MRSAAGFGPVRDSGYAPEPATRLPSARARVSPRSRAGAWTACVSAGRTASSGLFLAPESCCAVRAVVVSGLSDARSSQNCSSLTPPKVSAGHISSSTSAPLRKPTRLRVLAVLAASRPAWPSREGRAADWLPGLESPGLESPGLAAPSLGSVA